VLSLGWSALTNLREALGGSVRPPEEAAGGAGEEL